ncbi:DUF421 domain-containing protein [Legionella taurinensis]|uniref:DUF421 domain-containing protein n=1 Tax=Legionella taurinensis TaxID=70611 RepID=A0A3A5LJ79_9GAMM|nr:YetF domain-containing protein [Legionella taurinensis]MDX1836540.1 DUF421 domain-containing protein [Legionella taurinensis]PUT42995.1 DUF421 domain-containing protein [Legionella taurinensis]PUT45187.1 DUF421 domain-containing protein [Legionella taurinensis]PUT45551.1 DUF421 domain-containing protein [Legionella taurinensis]PUT49318.1 DUF421 domain-containing protein [Legionella taurinensis]
MTVAQLMGNLNTNPAFIYVIGRTIILFLSGILIIRYGNRRYSLRTTFDYLLIIILGGIISRGINGSPALLSTVTALFTLILLHRLIAVVTCHSTNLERFFKGRPRLLIEQGQLCERELQRMHITREDLLSELRSQLHSDDLNQIKRAYLEGGGRITFVRF